MKKILLILSLVFSFNLYANDVTLTDEQIDAVIAEASAQADAELLNKQPTLTDSASKKMDNDQIYVYVPAYVLHFKDFAEDEMTDLNDGLGGKNSLWEAHVLKWGKAPKMITDTHVLFRYSATIEELMGLVTKLEHLGLTIAWKFDDIDFTNPNQVRILLRWEAQDLMQKINEETTEGETE